MDVLASILICLGLKPVEHQDSFHPIENTHLLDEKFSDSYTDNPEVSTRAASFLHALLSTPDLKPTSHSILKSQFFANPSLSYVHNNQDLNEQSSWYEPLATAILNGLESALRTGAEVSNAIEDAIAKSTAAATAIGIFEDHPVFFTLLAIGVLAIVTPWVLEILGFAAEGILEGSWATIWQSRYLGFVPKGSLFSFLQRCGMVWG